jgi:DNA-binding NarL/FixJ family response regulator
VECHSTKIKEKLALRDRTQMVRFAADWGVVKQGLPLN